MTEEQIRGAEQRLLEERARVLRALRRTHPLDISENGGVDGSARYSQHMADAGSQAQEQETSLLVATREGERLGQIDAALRLLHANPARYFTCEECRERIEEARLDFLPWTRLCAADARRGDSA